MLQRFWLSVVMVLALVAVAPRAQAQSASTPRADATGPRIDRTATAMRLSPTAVDRDAALAAAAARKNMGQPVALMIVGGAAIVLGAVIGGDAGTLFMIGGAVTGLIGLYQYLQ